MKHWLAWRLRSLARRLDGREMVDGKVHRAGVEAMNEYVGQTERYIVALEAELPEAFLERARLEHERFDTARLVRAGAWKERR